jgi:hypothetical protein
VKKRQILDKKQNLDLVNNREDIKKKDLKADQISQKYRASMAAGGNHTKSQKEFKPLNLEHNYRSYSVSILPGTTKNQESTNRNLMN